MSVYSTDEQLLKLATYVQAYVRIPFFDNDSISGKAMEKIIGIVRDAEVLNTYDYVDVVRRGEVGWQVKSTKASTPLTWKRAKIAGSEDLIRDSTNDAGLAALGESIINYCNSHARQSIELYNLRTIGYCRLIVYPDNTVVYFEKEICSTDKSNIFESEEYTWKWSAPKTTKVKEQLSALHAFTKDGSKAFAWHGRGENQLHFSGETKWWPQVARPKSATDIQFSEDRHAISFTLPSDKADWKRLLDFLAS